MSVSVSTRPVPKTTETAARVSEFRRRTWRLYGDYLRQARTNRGLTLRELSDKLDVPFQTLQRLETGGPVRRDTLLRVERWLRRLG